MGINWFKCEYDKSSVASRFLSLFAHYVISPRYYVLKWNGSWFGTFIKKSMTMLDVTFTISSWDDIEWIELIRSSLTVGVSWYSRDQFNKINANTWFVDTLSSQTRYNYVKNEVITLNSNDLHRDITKIPQFDCSHLVKQHILNYYLLFLIQ